MRTKFQTVIAWLKAIGIAMTLAADAGQRIASAVDVAAKPPPEALHSVGWAVRTALFFLFA